MSLNRNHLPVRITPFVGRQDDLCRILDLLKNPSVRLVTILGTGGIGKTRLAIELARISRDCFQDGVFLIPLAQLNTIDELLPALAGALGIQLAPGCDLQITVLEYLADRQVLLVLDNFEHIVKEAVLLSSILAKSPRVRMLVTSREKLNLEAETLYRLDGLQLPPQDTLEDVQNFDAIRLFLQKAAQACPNFSLNRENTSSVVQICEIVDGSPLGILLAVAWLEYFSPAEVVKEICLSLDFLSTEVRDAEPRHCCMRAVFDASFNRLDERLQTVLRRLAVLRGSFDLPAAAAIAGADLRTLIALVDRSLLTRDPHSARYELHELLRQYMHERLEAAGEKETVTAAFANYYTAFVCQREQKLISPTQTTALDEIQTDFDHIRRAFAIAIETQEFEAARAALPGLYAFCDMRSRFYEGEAMFRQAVDGLTPVSGSAPDGAWALALLSWFDMRMYVEWLESYDEVTSQARSCLEQCRSVKDAQGIAASLSLLGAIAQHQADYKTAIRHCQQAMRVYPQLDDIYWVNMRIGLCYEADQQYDQAIRMFLSCLERGRQTGERVKTGWALQNIGDTLTYQGKLIEAQTYLDRAFALFQQVGTSIGVLWSLYSLSRVALSLGQLDRARELADAAAKLAHQVHSASWMKKTDALLQQLDLEPRHISQADVQSQNQLFSPRELEVLQLLKSELSGPDIAQRLIVSLNTVRYHTKNIYRKLGAGTRLEAIRRAKELGL